MEDLSSKLTGVLVDEAASEASSYSPDVVLPVTLVAAGEPGERMQMVSHDGTLLSTLALQGGDSAVGTTQFYIEQFPGASRRKFTVVQAVQWEGIYSGCSQGASLGRGIASVFAF